MAQQPAGGAHEVAESVDGGPFLRLEETDHAVLGDGDPVRRIVRDQDSGAADFARYRQEAHGFDQWLYHISPDRERIWELLRIGQPCSMEGLIMQKDVERQKQSILQEQFANSEKYDIAGSRYCTRNRMEDFMEECVRMISDFWM